MNDHNANSGNDFGTKIMRLLPLMLREISKRLTESMPEGFLTLPQLVVLDLLSGEGSCNMSEVAEALNLTMGAATGAVDKMIELGMIARERSQEDRRVVNVTMTDQGKETIARVNLARRDICNDIFSSLSEDERSQYLGIIGKIINNLRKGQG
ncbi:MAG: MarR family transcriptional regulator [Candidatus Omnitrophota bacterium]